MGNNNLDHLVELFNTIRESNLHMNYYSMASPEHDFWKYDSLKSFFCYYTPRNDPNALIPGRQVYEAFNNNFYFDNDGKFCQRTLPNIEVHSLEAIPNDIPVADFLAQGLNRLEVANEVREFSEEINAFDENNRKLDILLYGLSDMGDHPYETLYKRLMCEFYNEFDLSQYSFTCSRLDGFSMPAKTTPVYRAANFANLVGVIEQLEIFSKMLSSSPGELYYKLDLRENALLKNRNFIIEDILNYYHYLDEDCLHARTDKIKLPIVLYKTQEMRELFCENICDVPHYTPEEFLTMCTNAALNLSYIIYKGGLQSEVYYEMFGYDNAKFSVFKHNLEINEIYPCDNEWAHRPRSELFKSAQGFIYSCEKIKEIDTYINTHYVGERLINSNFALDRARHTLIHKFLSDVFVRDIVDTIPKKFNSSWDQFIRYDVLWNTNYFFR